MKKLFLLLVIAMSFLVVLCHFFSNQKITSDVITVNVEAIAENEKPLRLDCLPEGDGCDVIVQLANDVCYTITLENAHNAD
ncbi:MAG: hypothetical protein IJQ93_02045 [Bacteroidales bacterium]|nr:hypothetical protein [Bacteroidales bacterium]